MGLAVIAFLTMAQQEPAASDDYARRVVSLEAARDQASGRELAAILNNLGTLYWNLARLRDAENAYERSLTIRASLGETGTREVARTLNNLGIVYTDLQNFSKAEEIIGRAAALHEKLGGDDPGLAHAWLNLGSTYRAERRWEEAETMFRKSLDLDERGASKLDIAMASNNLGVVLRERGSSAEAGEHLTRAAAIWESHLGPEHPLVGTALNNLGVLYTRTGEYDRASDAFERAIHIAEVSLPPDHPSLAGYRTGYAALLRKLDRKKEAKQMETLARNAQERHIRSNLLGHTVDARQLSK
jgi:tetratricopeptide (TPR) repeat protein